MDEGFAESNFVSWVWTVLRGPIGKQLTSMPREAHRADGSFSADPELGHVQIEAEGPGQQGTASMAEFQQPGLEDEGHNCTADATAAGEAHMLCMMESPPGGHEQMRALWAWAQLNLAAGLLEGWAQGRGLQVCVALTYGLSFYILFACNCPTFHNCQPALSGVKAGL